MTAKSRTTIVRFGEVDTATERLFSKLENRYARLESSDPSALSDLLDAGVPLLLVFDLDRIGPKLQDLSRLLAASRGRIKCVALYSKAKDPKLLKLDKSGALA
ncbi:MAG: hypothetical protein AB1405_18285, partial [Bdellovibrionota bacterium]